MNCKAFQFPVSCENKQIEFTPRKQNFSKLPHSKRDLKQSLALSSARERLDSFREADGAFGARASRSRRVPCASPPPPSCYSSSPLIWLSSSRSHCIQRRYIYHQLRQPLLLTTRAS
uniref:Uncharacterized protein n=1 Tax=Oryza punctata TaxID=4537 RepID=A0A0E0JFA1_ORYPU